MNTYDTLAGVALGVYLVLVAYNGNTKNMIDLAKRDRAFLQWAIALAILWYLYGIPELRGVVSMLILTSFVGLGLIAGGNIAQQAKIFWSSLKG